MVKKVIQTMGTHTESAKALSFSVFFSRGIKIPSVKIVDYFWLSIRETVFPYVKISQKLKAKTNLYMKIYLKTLK